MPIIQTSTYRAPLPLRNGHLNTIFAGAFRSIQLNFQRERIDTPDGDFLDLDWSLAKSNKLVILLHGLEGNARRPYIQGMIRLFNQNGWDGLGMNFRGCSGEPNRLLRSYHIGETTDLAHVIRHVEALDRYREVALVGFSLGGNVVMKYVGEQGTKIPKILKKAVAISVPCHVPSANERFKQWENALYMYRFMRTLNQKVTFKAKAFPDQLKLPHSFLRNFDEFDTVYTAPAHGFADAPDYWTRSSSFSVLPEIATPTLLINAADDSFLSDQCYPRTIAECNKNFYLEIPRWGGHCGFVTFSQNGIYWSETRTLEFISSEI